jgi:hypothetical protein
MESLRLHRRKGEPDFGHGSVDGTTGRSYFNDGSEGLSVILTDTFVTVDASTLSLV